MLGPTDSTDPTGRPHIIFTTTPKAFEDFRAKFASATEASAISFKDDPGIYEGPELEPGHFKVASQGGNFIGRGTFHRLSGEDVLEGYYLEDGHEGMWRLHLEE